MNIITTQTAPGLQNEELQKIAPSVFAQHADEDCSSRYKFIPTIEVVEGLRKEGWFPVRGREMRVRLEGRKGFQKHKLCFQRAEDIARAKTLEVNRYSPSQHKIVKGEVMPELVLINSHDRTSAYNLHAGLFRLLCSNGLMVCDATFARLSIPHRGDDVRDVIEGSYEVIREVPQILNRVDEMKAKPLALEYRKAFAEAGAILKFGSLEESPVSASTILQPRRSSDTAENLWDTLNVIQENLTRGGLRYVKNVDGKIRRGKTRDVKSIDENVRLNKALWHIAEKFKTNLA